MVTVTVRGAEGLHKMGCMKDEQDAPSVSLTCSEGGEDDPVVERLCGAVVVLQQHPVCILSFTGVKNRLHLQQLQWRWWGERARWGYQWKEAFRVRRHQT